MNGLVNGRSELNEDELRGYLMAVYEQQQREEPPPDSVA
jgi:hypothetical protein